MSAVVYLTGVPGSGKTTVARALSVAGDVLHLSYSEYLAKRLATTRESLREQSARIVTTDVVMAVDEEICALVAEGRVTTVVIDSHAVTCESYGLRVIPFRRDILDRLRLDTIICLTADPAVLVDRVKSAREGRRDADVDFVAAAQRVQEAVATSYAVTLGVPLHLVDADVSLDAVISGVSAIVERLHRL